jgi:PPOX class probable F420-dependent enzyme
MTTHIHYPSYPVTPAIKAIYRASNNNLTTFRKNGTPVSTPVTCAEHDGIIYFATGADSGKVKRIRHTTHITLAPCTARGRETGDTVEAHARVITEVAETYKAKGALQSKYGLRRQIIYVIMKTIQLVRKQPEIQQVYVAIEFSHEHPHN